MSLVVVVGMARGMVPVSSAEEARMRVDAMVLQQLQQLEQSPRLQEGRNWLARRREHTNDEMVALAQVPAPPFAEQERAMLFIELLQGAGIDDVSRDAVGNVIGRIAGRDGRRTVAVVAHLDTVFPAATDVAVARTGDLFRAPGIGDNARGVAMLVALGEAIARSGLTLRDNLLLIGSVGEEGLGDLRGMRALLGEDGPQIDALIAIDGGRIDRLVTTAVGSNRYRITFTGPGGHSYGQFGRANPHHALADAISAFSKRAADIVAGANVKATYSVGRIGGGTSINAIAFESWMEVDLRSTDADVLQSLDAALQTAVAGALDQHNQSRVRGDALAVAVTPVGRRPAGQQDSNLPLIQNALAALRVAGIEAQLSASSTDANLAIAANIPAVTISRGGISRNAHALNESWQDTNTLQSEWAALLLIAAEAGIAQ